METVDKATALSDAPSPKVVGEPSRSSDDSGFGSREDSGRIVLSCSLSNEVTHLGSEDNVVIPPPLEFQDHFEDGQGGSAGSVGPHPTANRPQPPPSVRQPAAETEMQAPEECDPDANESSANCFDLTCKLQEKKSDKVLETPKAIQKDYNMIRPTIEDEKVYAKIDQDFDTLTTEVCRNNIDHPFPPTTRDKLQDIDLDNVCDGEEVVAVERSMPPCNSQDQAANHPDPDLTVLSDYNECNGTVQLLADQSRAASQRTPPGYWELLGQCLMNGYDNGEVRFCPHEDSCEIEAKRRWAMVGYRLILMIMLLLWKLQIEVQRCSDYSRSEDLWLVDWSLLPEQNSRSVVLLFAVKLFLLPVVWVCQGEKDSLQQMLQEGPLIENIEVSHQKDFQVIPKTQRRQCHFKEKPLLQREERMNLIDNQRDHVEQQQKKEEHDLHNVENVDGLFSDAVRDSLGLRKLRDAGIEQVLTCAAAVYIPERRSNGVRRRTGPQPAPENMRCTVVTTVVGPVQYPVLIQHRSTVDIPAVEPTVVVDPPPRSGTLLSSPLIPPVPTGQPVAQVSLNNLGQAGILSDDADGARPRRAPPRPQTANSDEEENVATAARRRRKWHRHNP